MNLRSFDSERPAAGVSARVAALSTATAGTAPAPLAGDAIWQSPRQRDKTWTGGTGSLRPSLVHPLARAATAVFASLLALFQGTAPAQTPPSVTQTIELSAGWNLISIQVGNAPIPVADFAAQSGLGADLIEIWGYQATGSTGIPGSWQTYQPTVPNYPSDLSHLHQGRGYWINVARSLDITLTGPPWDGDLTFMTGWNLVGFPGVNFDAAEAQDLSSVFGASFDRVAQVWTFDASAQRFVGYDLTSVPMVKELGALAAGQGYWVYALEPITLSATPWLALIQDADASPLQSQEPFRAVDFPSLPNPQLYLGKDIRKVGAGDGTFDLNGNGIIDDPFTQNTLRFDAGVDRKVISIGNNTTGLVNWSLVNAVPWLYTATADAKKYPGNTGRPKNASGAVSSDRDTLVLYVDRTGLTPGRETGSFTAYIGGVARTIEVQMDIPTAAGDWKGSATAQRVNGKDIPLGKIDLALNLFMESDSSNETRFRAVLNRDESLLFPRDVFMNGVFYSGNDFSSTTTFLMGPGDRNAPPFEEFSPVTTGTDEAKVRGDKDYGRPDVLDVMNPFPFEIRREVTLIGSQVGTDRMEGTYVEALGGMLPNDQKIFVEGTFSLERRTLEPTRRSIFNDYAPKGSPISIGGSSGQPYRQSVITVGEAVNIQNVVVTLGVDFQAPANLIITLTAPDGRIVTLHRNGTTLAANTTFNLADFNGASGAGNWTLKVEWNPASGERGFLNNWALNIEGLATYNVTGTVVGDTGSGVVPLAGAQLVLSGSNLIEQTRTGGFTATAETVQGQTTVNLSSGTTEGFRSGLSISGHAGIPGGATVATIVDHDTFTLSTAATATTSASATFGTPGVFRFSSLTENNYSLAISQPGFDSRRIFFFVSDADVDVGTLPREDNGSGQIQLTPVSVPSAELRAATRRVGEDPQTVVFVGADPQNVVFTVIIPLSQLNGSVGANPTASWDFGDGTAAVLDTASTSDDITLTSASHIYVKPGFFTPTVTLAGGAGSLPVSCNVLVHRTRPDPAGAAWQISGVSFVGAFAAPLSDAGNPVQISSPSTVASYDLTNDGQPALTSVATGTVYQESKRDSGAFDLDREPFIPAPKTANSNTLHPNAEDSDFFTQSGTAFHSQSPTAANGVYDEYQQPVVGGKVIPDRFRIFTTHGGYVFGAEPARVGAFKLQTGRVEP